MAVAMKLGAVLEGIDVALSSVCGPTAPPATNGIVLPMAETCAVSAEPQAAATMRRLWLRMSEIYGYRWSSAYGEDADQGAGTTWARGLAGMAPRDIATGLSAALVSSDPWPPTLPAFRAMCLAIPDLPAVTLALRARTLATPFLRLAWQYIDGYRLRVADQTQADRLIRDAYVLAREHVMAGGALPPPPAALVAQQPEVHRPADPATAAKHMADIAAVLNVGDVETDAAPNKGEAA